MEDSSQDEKKGARPGQSPWTDSGLAQQDFPAGLYVVATPIGNAADVTLRALWVLRIADCIAAEDTRTTSPLLARYGIEARLIALHQHNESRQTPVLLERLARGERVALVSDAGTPAISDPGAGLVRAALAANLRVIPVPGASSMTAMLSAAGVRTGDIRFAGFAPARGEERRRHFRAVASAAGATVLFEAPHRIADTARELSAVLESDRRIVVGRELTKKFESVSETTAGGLPGWIQSSEQRGEFVLVVDAPAEAPAVDEDAASVDAATARWLEALAAELPASRVAAIGVKATGLPRKLLYHFLGAGKSGKEGECE